MVQQKRSGYGFNGYQVPSMPRGSRSARGKTSFKKKADSGNMCAFDLLATVAGELLQEQESSLLSPKRAVVPRPSDAVKIEPLDRLKPLKREVYDQGSCDESALSFHKRVPRDSEVDVIMDRAETGKGHHLKCSPNKPDTVIGEGFSGGGKNVLDGSIFVTHGIVKDERGGCAADQPKAKRGYDIVGDVQTETKGNGRVINGLSPSVCCMEDPMAVDTKASTLVSSDSSVEVPFPGGNASYIDSFVRCHNNGKIDGGDDDENSSGCTDPSTRNMRSYKPTHIGDPRIRKFMASKFYKVSPTFSRNGELSNYDNGMKLVYRSRKLSSARHRSQRVSTNKRRKFSERGSTLTSDGGNSSEGLSDSSGKPYKGAASFFIAKKHGVNGPSSSLVGERSSYGSSNSHVKLRIKSFKVPELLVEIPETATVGLLKRTVLEAVTSILGSGIRVGVLLQGEKVRDDNKTLVQSGISVDDKLDGLGFALEPGPVQSSLPHLYKEEAHFSHGDKGQEVPRQPTIPSIEKLIPDGSIEPSRPTMSNHDESSYALMPNFSDSDLDKTAPYSQALVSLPVMNVDALAVVPHQCKSRRPELAQRRTRRPFSVAEVEALVHAVEELGTGRWRDVKLRAFENAKHRTYVDLKDKWKTLVHTARISPQQRRGEPVPQELLDRVLTAHAFWSHLQAKQQVKQQNGESGEEALGLDGTCT